MGKHANGSWRVDRAKARIVAGEREIASVFPCDSREEEEANANLLAASEALLASLDPRTLQNIAEELASGSYERAGGLERLSHAIFCLREQAKLQLAAIAKAEGKAP